MRSEPTANDAAKLTERRWRMSRLTLRGRLKANAVVLLRLSNSPSTRKDLVLTFHTIKTAIHFLLCLAVVFSAHAREFRPDGRLENIPASDTSIQQCYIFRTVPGVIYRIESCNDLSSWAAGEEIYGMGHEYVTAMREFTPPPPPPPGSPPTTPPVPAIHASLRIRPSSGAAGGTVVSWKSLDHGGPVTMLLAQAMTSNWNRMPLFWDRFGNHDFFIGNDLLPIPPPAENPALGAKDAAVFAQLETSFPAINLAVDESVARARNTPPPAPPDPNSRKFWRVFCDWSVDTDQDGSPDWMEFEMDGTAADGLRGDAFNADTNNNGSPDGEELDYDGDGMADAKDVDADDKTASYPIGPSPRYALFPIPGSDIPQPAYTWALQINDKGRVLYDTGTWSAGVWTPLAAPAGQAANAYAINDNDVIVGTGSYPISTDPVWSRPVVYHWKTHEAAPQPVHSQETIGDEYAGRLVGDYEYHGYAPRPLLSNDGRLTARTKKWGPGPGVDGVLGSDGIYRSETETGVNVWTLPTGTDTLSTLAGGSYDLPFHQAPGLTWGYTVERDENGNEAGPRKGKVLAPAALPELAFQPYQVFSTPSGILALPASEAAPRCFRDNAWHDAPLFKNAVDMADDGTAIGKSHDGKAAPILINGKWTDIERHAPGLPGEWKDSPTLRLYDTTSSGWVLARRGDGSEVDPQNAAVMLPIRLNGVDPGYTPPTVPEGQPVPEPPDYFSGGVDHLAARADGGSGYVPELWIMAPIEGSTSVRWKSPLNATNKLKPECEKAAFAPQEITASGTNVQVSGNAPASGEDLAATDFNVSLKLGSAEVVSSSMPVKVKRMKRRTVKVALHKVIGIGDTGVRTSPQYMPTAGELAAYLNKVYVGQVNASFVVVPYDESGGSRPHPEEEGIDFDMDNNHKLGIDGQNPELSAATPNPKAGSVLLNISIDVWVIGGNVSLSYLDGFSDQRAGGAKITETGVIVDGDLANVAKIQNNQKAEHILHSIAHEIGHIMSDDRHPDESGCKSRLLWGGNGGRDPYMQKRLMCSGFLMDNKNPGESLIKKEWDLIEEWLEIQEELSIIIP